MGRMFRIITEGPIEAVTAGAALAHAAESEPFVVGDAPFIEVGGPAPVFQMPKAARPIPLEQTPPPAAKPHEYLSVSLHPIALKSAPKISPIAAEIVAFHQPDHEVSREYHELADKIRLQVGDGGPKALLLTAAARERGTTTVLLNLAATLADEARVLVIDADFDHPAAARMLGVSDVPGLSEALAQTTPLAWLLQPTVITNLQALSIGTSMKDATLADFPKIIAQLRKWFDWILVDAGIWGERPDRDAVSSSFDALYAVARHSDASLTALRPQTARHGGLLRGYITTQI
jgi:Mrp family chromosome partitioning ATPase